MRSLLRVVLAASCLPLAIVVCMEASSQEAKPRVRDEPAANNDAPDKAACRNIALPPPTPRAVKQLAACVATTEREFRLARDHYTYRQTFEFIEEGGGNYKAISDVTFTPEGKRIEKPLNRPANGLKRIVLTDEDFRDLTEVQPFVLDPDDLWNYDVKFVDEQTLGGMPVFTLNIKPRQTFEGQRLFDGVVWVTKDGFQVVQLDGRAVPNLVRRGQENLFPRFTTTRAKIDGKHWFPVLTVGDDVLKFKSGPVRVHFTIRYEQYKRFQAESRIQYKED